MSEPSPEPTGERASRTAPRPAPESAPRPAPGSAAAESAPRPAPGSAAAAPSIVVLMGVAGCGKTAVMGELVRRLGWPAAEGDEFHSPANVAKMAAGVPLTDEDRGPWLRALAAWIGERGAAGRSALVTCSALRRSYRDLLREGHPSVAFAHLRASPEVLAARISGRPGHYMPVSLLGSQLATLEPLAPDEPGLTVDADRPLDEVVGRVLDWLSSDASRTGGRPRSGVG